MSVFKCKMCGGELSVNENLTVGTCQYCGSTMTLPRDSSQEIINLYNRANHYRMNYEFDKATGIYESILNKNNNESEAYWGLVLCKFGVVYVEDPRSRKRIPTCHRAQYLPIFADPDYKAAISNSSINAQELLKIEADIINKIQSQILDISSKEKPFDIFICYKETDEVGNRSRDSVLAQELYFQLINRGYKVFFSRITLEDKLGSAYEPYIFSALHSSKVMVVVGTKPEHINSPWVKNEWSRYLALINKGEDKTLIPAYRDMDPYDLPEEFSYLQAQDMAKLGFMQDLVRGIEKVISGSTEDKFGNKSFRKMENGSSQVNKIHTKDNLGQSSPSQPKSSQTIDQSYKKNKISTPKKGLRYLTFGSLYFTQGTIQGFFAALNALYLLDNGLNLTDIGVFGFIALLPFVLKIGLGILSDRVNLFGMGHRKPYILIGLVVQLGCLVIAPFIDPGQYFWGYVAMAFTLQMGMALYDTCTDGLALDTTPQEEQSTIQGFMVGGRAIGVIVAASVVGLLAENVSWLAVFWSLAALTLLPAPLVLILREEARDVGKRFDWQAFKAFDGKTFLAAGLGTMMFVIILGVNQLVNPFLANQMEITLSEAGFITSLWGAGVVGGSLVGGWLLRRFRLKPGLSVAVLILSLAILGITFFIDPRYGLPVAIAMVIFFGVAYGAYQTEYFAVAMRLVDPRIAASMYAILMAFTNIGQGIGMYLSGALADKLGYQSTFLILFGLNLLILPFIQVVFKSKKVVPETA